MRFPIIVMQRSRLQQLEAGDRDHALPLRKAPNCDSATAQARATCSWYSSTTRSNRKR